MSPRTVLRLLACSLLGVVLAGCDPAWVSSWILPKEEVEIARTILDELQTKNFAALEQKLDPRLRTPEVRAQLEQAANALAGEQTDRRVAINSSILATTTIKRYGLAFHSPVQDGSAISEVAFERDGTDIRIVHLVVRPISAAEERMNEFTLSGKGAMHYAVLLFAVAVPAFTVAAVIACVRTPMRRRKWLWIVFILVGVGKFSLNWTTGQFGIFPLSVQLLGVSFAKQLGVAPWILSVSFPLGAIVFLWRRKRLMKPAVDAPQGVR